MTQLEEARKLYRTANTDQKYVLEKLFPELKESEDERIRKAIIGYIDHGQHYGVSDKDMLAWLEKQREQKPATIDIDKMVDDYANNKERGNEEFGKPVNCMIRAYRQGLNDAIGKVVLKPAWSKDDDSCLSTIIAEFSKCAGKSVSKDEWMRCNDFLNSLRDRVQPQPKQEWSEEDEKMLADAYIMLDWYKGNNWWKAQYIKDWLKSLKERYTWKPSDEQLNNILDVLSFDNCTSKRRELLESLYQDLKKLKKE